MEPLRWRIIRVEEKGGVDEPGILSRKCYLYVNPVSPGDPADRASMLTLVIGLSVTQAIRSNLGLQAQIKWPNDVVLNGKKLVGI